MSDMLVLVSVFVAVLFISRLLIRHIPPLLHTPLMSMTNAVSGITVVAAILLFCSRGRPVAEFLAALAVISAMFNLVGGFFVTYRMLDMFKDKDGDKRES